MTRSFVSVTPQRIVLASCALLAALFAIGWMTREDPGEKPLLQVLGGGFVYNYRISEMHYGFSAAVAKPLASGSIIEASFEDPAGGEPHTVRERVTPRSTRYALHSPPIRGVEARRPYRVAVRVLDRQGEAVLWSRDLDFVSQVDDRIVAEAPLIVGPGHHPSVADFWWRCRAWWCRRRCERFPKSCKG
ncbi:hypothetical protein [Nitratireductor pacificus]|uniref:Uncharacterized protein n=1 Tax=Nitratireductor pacificus pht-3B TaxID=391937 RepID=K2N9N8_9HYPH|nr:hypothetical protein [Nitratireductor pacificus]EKF20853.1 hypothetical protein NA2_00705 [Nitratireductor pacificus pht-3B]